tara:strand:- start:1126 stop:1548 length:423 start_codon:yes stop_codon:yes gene_type:complete
MAGAFENGSMVSTIQEDTLIEHITNEQIEFLSIDKMDYLFLPPISIDKCNFNKSIHVYTRDGVIIKCSDITEFYTVNDGWVNVTDLKINHELVCASGDSFDSVILIEEHVGEYSMNVINMEFTTNSNNKFGHIVHNILVK